MQIADWDLLFSHNGLAVEGYALAHDMLERAGAARGVASRSSSRRRTPVVLPAFEPNPLARDETRAATGHIDVAFAITKYGRGRDVEIRDAANATDDARSTTSSVLVKSSRFRPQLTDGRFAESPPVVVRYHLYD